MAIEGNGSNSRFRLGLVRKYIKAAAGRRYRP